ncbi:DUF4145 domain-containing protein [Altericroceibacterium xinjiangense]|uniref:DUF4145 domain-containing protein n=1 Tax=Altericroceibacterium xinjiangense TaxID=762261 RepID=UPI000F7DD561|nr:DUF4145 domain-containing protein [Altericroceibacterium xinjiangense]
MNFTCPHCGTVQVATDGASASGDLVLEPGKSHEMGAKGKSIEVTCGVVRCANENCNRLTVDVVAHPGAYGEFGYRSTGDQIFGQRVYPKTCGKPFPEGVPAAMLADYNEAWLIVDLSPKSSATLARRCLQAMIRDFCKIRERTLYQEIEKLEQKLQVDELPKGVEPETIAAMRVLKDKGNIGAHMTEVNGVIVDVEPQEAEQLLGLIEMLFTDWYVARHKRQQSLAAIEAMAKATPGRDAH